MKVSERREAWDQFIGSDYVGRVPIERKLARVPAPGVFPREPKKPVTSEHHNRSQITDHRKKLKWGGRERGLRA